MIWVTWRQMRTDMAVGVALVAALAAFALPIGIQKFTLFRESGLEACLSAGTQDCSALARRFLQSFSSFDVAINATIVLAPALMGILWAAPVFLEFERRTYRLAWTQSVTRGHWLAVKLGVALSEALLFGATIALVFTWWLSPEANLRDPFDRLFVLRGVAPAAYSVFCLALALAFGTLTRRTIPAMIVTLIGFFIALHLVGDGLRPHYAPPVEKTLAIGVSPEAFGDFLPDRAWIVGSSVIDGSGNEITTARQRELCGTSNADLTQCLEKNGVRRAVLFHPPDRFWKFQAIEGAIFLAAALPFLGLTVWAINTRSRWRLA